MAKYLKFIVTEDYDLRGGYVEFHADILPRDKRYKNSVCLGGGFFVVNEEGKEIHLYGSSTDFGKCSKQVLERAIKEYGNDFKSELWMIMYTYYLSQGKEIDSDELDYRDYKITTDYAS